ncbi:peroxynitrite isomerase THAP4 isoform X2 [Pseudophryne corroboree]
MDSFVPRMPDQHPLLRPNAVPSLFESGRENKRSGAPGSHILQVGKRKRVQKRLSPSSRDKKSCFVFLGERRHHSNIGISSDLMDTSLPSKPPKSHTASKFIFSLHSYSRSSMPSLSQNVVNMAPSPHLMEAEAEHLCGGNPEHLPTLVQGTENFLSEAGASKGLPCHIEVGSDNTLASIVHIPLELEINQSEILEFPPSVLEESSLYPRHGRIPENHDLLVPDNINSLHSYSSIARPLSTLEHQCRSKEWTTRGGEPLSDTNAQDCPPLNPAVSPLAWMLGSWISDPAGEGEFPSIPSFRYVEEAVISHVGQPMLNFMFSSSNPETGTAMHRECGFIRVKPGTNQVAFICAQNMGLVEVEEGEVQGEQLSLTSHSLSRISFAKEPHVQKISRIFRLTSDGKLEQTVSMATSTQAMAPHLHVTYRKVTS